MPLHTGGGGDGGGGGDSATERQPPVPMIPCVAWWAHHSVALVHCAYRAFAPSARQLE